MDECFVMEGGRREIFICDGEFDEFNEQNHCGTMECFGLLN